MDLFMFSYDPDFFTIYIMILGKIWVRLRFYNIYYIMLYGGLRGIVGRIGGKTMMRKQIVDNFPEDIEIYIEPFVGGGSVFFYKNPSPVEVLNDNDKDLMTVFKGFKKYGSDRIENDTRGHYYTEKQFNQLKNSEPKDEYDKFLRLLILYKTSFYGMGKNAEVYEANDPRGFHNPHYAGYQERLKNTILLSKDYKDVIKEYDSKNAFFYLDPPFIKTIYGAKIDLNELADVLHKIKGRFLLSIIDDPEVRNTFKGFKMKTITNRVAQGIYGSQRLKKKHLLITNY